MVNSSLLLSDFKAERLSNFLITIAFSHQILCLLMLFIHISFDDSIDLIVAKERPVHGFKGSMHLPTKKAVVFNSISKTRHGWRTKMSFENVWPRMYQHIRMRIMNQQPD
ncbi:hypothetical protein YC2023_085860 [Brassica napus]